MQKLNKFITKKILKSAILPIIAAEILLVITVFTAAVYQSRSNQALLLERSQKSYTALTMQVAQRMAQAFENVKKDTTALKNILENHFDNRAMHQKMALNFCSEAGFHFIRDLPITSIYTTNIKQLTEEDKINLQLLALSVPPIDAILSPYGKKIDTAWVNIGAKYTLFYPEIDFKEALSPDLDATEQSYYYQADAQHNPEKKTLFIPLFQEPWALTIGQIGAVVSPIYHDGVMEGVVGVSLTSENTQKLSDIALPFGAYVMITDTEGYLLFSSDEARSQKDFQVSSFAGLYKAGKEDKLKTFSVSEYQQAGYLFHEHQISDTGLNLILVAQSDEVSMDVLTIFDNTRKIGLLIFLCVFILHIYLYRALKANMKKMTAEISGPVMDVSKASHRLFKDKALEFQPTDIKELHVLHVNLEKAHKKLINQLYIDALTQLPNEKKLILDQQVLEQQALEQQALEQQSQELILVSLDNFRHISHMYGQHMSDRIILDFIRQLAENMQDYQLYRVSFDTFALLGQAHDALSQHYDTISNITLIEDNISIMLNISLASAGADKPSELSLFARAQIALDEAKSQQHISYLVFNESKHLKDYKENLQWAKRLQEAFDENRLVAYFQPIYDIKQRKVYKFESLVRMLEGDKVISPFFFLGAAARMGKLSDITQLMLKQVFKVSQQYPGVEFSINVSFEDFEQANLLADIQSLAAEYGINPNNIIFELLETGSLSDENKIIETIKALKALGCKIAIDDFGAGNSNFAHLMLMKVDYIKIDGQFVKNILSNKQSLNITKTIKAFADMTDSKTIAEFVSETAIFEEIEALGIDFAQGYCISEPKPADSICDMLKIVQ